MLLMRSKNGLHVFQNRSRHPESLYMTHLCPAVFDISSIHCSNDEGVTVFQCLTIILNPITML